MRISTSVEQREIPDLITEFFTIVGWANFKKRAESLREQVTKNPFFEPYFQERFALERELSRLHERRRRTNRFVCDFMDERQNRLASFVAMVAGVQRHLSPGAKNRLAGMLRGALKDDRGLAPLASEMAMAAHLMTKGFDVFFNDLETGGGFDFLAAREGVEIEVECKHVSGDIGRRVHQRHVHQLGKLIYPLLNRKVERQPGGWLLKATVPDRLTGSDEQHQAISKIFERTLETDRNYFEPSVCSLVIQPFSLADSPFSASSPNSISQRAVMDFADERLGGSNKHVICLFQPRRAAAVVVVDSSKPDKVLDGIYRQLKDSSRDQLSGTRPGLMCVHLEDVTESDLVDLARGEGDEADAATGLQAMTTAVLLKRPHVHTIAFTAIGEIESGKQTFENRTEEYAQGKGPAYFFRNPNHPLAADPRLKIF